MNIKGNKIIGADVSYCYKELRIPETSPSGELITEIESRAFRGLRIDTLIIPASIKRIKSQAFENCGIKDLIFEGEGTDKMAIDQNAFSSNNIVELYIPKNTWYIGKQTFSNNPIEKISGGEGLKTIYDFGFKDCNLKTVNLKSLYSIKVIGKEAFSNNKNLTEVLFPFGLSEVEINDSAFNFCDNIKKISIPFWVSEEDVLPLFNCPKKINVSTY